MFLSFMTFVFIISSLVILYSDDYMFGDLNIIRFILLVLISILILLARCQQTYMTYTSAVCTVKNT